MKFRTVGVAVVSLVTLISFAPHTALAAPLESCVSAYPTGQTPEVFDPSLEQAEYSANGFLIYRLHLLAPSIDGDSLRINVSYHTDHCEPTKSSTGNRLVTLTAGVEDVSIRFTSLLTYEIWDDTHDTRLEQVGPVDTVVPPYSIARAFAARSSLSINTYAAHAYQIQESASSPVFSNTAVKPAGCPDKGMTGFLSFDFGNENAEYVNGLLRTHLRFSGNFYPNLVFDRNGGFSAGVAFSNDPCTHGEASSFNLSFRGPSHNVWYFSYRFTSPTHWVLWDDENDRSFDSESGDPFFNFCNFGGCSGDIPDGSKYAYFFAQQFSGSGGASWYRTTPFAVVEPKVTCTPGIDHNCNSNVMFLPGMESSELFAPGVIGENKIWLPNSLAGLDVQNLDLTNSASANNVYTKEKGIIDFAYGGFGVYAKFIIAMTSLQNGDHAFNEWEPIAYDWRLDYEDLLAHGNDINGKIYYRGTNAATSTPYIVQELKRLASTSRTGKVTIVAHSNGGLLAKALLTHPEYAQYVDKLVMVAVPQLGTPQAVGALLQGYDQGLPSVASRVFNDANARFLALNAPSAYNLLPSSQYFTYTDNPVITFNPASMPDWLIKYSDVAHPGAGIHSTTLLRNFMTDSTRGTPDRNDTATPAIASRALFDTAMSVHINLDATTTGVRVITIAGWGNETLSSIEYTREQNGCAAQTVLGCASPTYSGQITYNPHIVIDGDGTVVESSAQWTSGASTTRYWVNLDTYNCQTPFTCLPQNGPLSVFRTAHANIFEVPQLNTLLSNLITNSSAGLPQYITATQPMYNGTEPRLHFVLHSPLTLGFIDSSGNYTGSTATTSVSNIPGVDYERFGEVQWLSVPKSLAGKVIMRGTGTGTFALDIESVNGNTTLATTTFAAVPTATSTVATIIIDPNTSPTQGATLSVDFNGDGTVDRTLQAKQGNIVLPDITPPEAVITVSTTTKDILVLGIDDTSPTTTIAKTATTTTITDQSGNKTTLFFQKTFNGNILTYAKLTGISYGTSTTPLPSSFLYVWDATKTLISQTVVANSQFAIEALYDKKKDKTTIIVFKKNVLTQTTTLTGLRLIKLTTNKGVVSYSW